MAENAATAPRPARPGDSGALRRRILSALVLVPVALGCVWIGRATTVPLVALAAGLMAWEWGRLIGRLSSTVDMLLFCGTAALAVLAAGFLSIPAGAAVAVVGIAGLLVLGGNRRPAWTGLGMVWIILPCIGFAWLRGDSAAGFATALWVMLLVWAIDTAAYVAGRGLGGPKLAPQISPNKTWSGLLGGIVGAMVVGGVAGWLSETSALWRITLLSGGLAVVEQIGDIAESYAKRRFGAKDSGSLIPGHGGLLDRLDGMLAVVTAVVLLQIVSGGSLLTGR
jgi:phosphatidate cytidylyltransferase